MKISDAINLLQQTQEQCGDLEIICSADGKEVTFCPVAGETKYVIDGGSEFEDTAEEAFGKGSHTLQRVFVFMLPT